MPGRHMGLTIKRFTPLHKHKLCGITATIATLSVFVSSRPRNHFLSFERFFLNGFELDD